MLSKTDGRALLFMLLRETIIQLFSFLGCSWCATADDYTKEVEMMVQQTIKHLTVLDGWLSVVGNIYPDTKCLLNRYALYNRVLSKPPGCMITRIC